MKEIYEKAGLFYLGKDVDRDNFEPLENLTLIKNKNFTTHATIIGMTGSGKTGLGIDLIEEATIDNIPSIIIDPKGDMGNLLLADPEFEPKNFAKWVRDEADNSGESLDELAQSEAKKWEEGILSYHQDRERVARFAKVKKSIYTPGSQSGIPINLVSSLSRPSQEILDDSDSLSLYLKNTVSSILALLKIEADPIKSKEYVLLANIIMNYWSRGEDLTIETIISQIISPPFKKIGILPLESFYPESERFALATKFNAIVASPNFLNWLTGESLDIQKLLYDENGKAKVSIFSISHLSDEERMFFVTLLLNKFIAWMRTQSGSSRLKSILYMDEIYGYFPPVKNPPSKEPMMLLLKQARAFGVGVILSTQNPSDLDYKGLSNIGTWFIGRLQTTQDIERVVDGLSSKIGDNISKKEIKELLANMKKRTFLLKSNHLDSIRLFRTRWTLSYLKGPLSKDDIKELMATQKAGAEVLAPQKMVDSSDDKFLHTLALSGDIREYFEPSPTPETKFYPAIGAKTSIYIHDKRRGIDKEIEESRYLDLDEDMSSLDFELSEVVEVDFTSYPTKAPSKAKFLPLPEIVTEDKALKSAKKELVDYLYRNFKLKLFKCKALRVESTLDESQSDFLARVEDILEEKKEAEIDKLKERYAKKGERLQSQLQRALERLQKEKSDQTSSLLSAGASILGALFGRTTATKIGTAVSRGSRVLKERDDLSRAEARVAQIEEKIEDLEMELEDKIEEIYTKYSIDNYEIEEIFIKPKKSNIDVEDIAIVWRVI